MWELVAAAAAGLNAGAGLYVAMAEHPAGLEAGPSTYWNFFPKVSTKAVALSTTLSLLTAGGAAAAYFSGKRFRHLLWWGELPRAATLSCNWGASVGGPALRSIPS